MHRRSRGFVPLPLMIGSTCDTTVLGAGAEMKNTFCLVIGNEAFLSQHHGEINTLEAETAYLESLNRMMKLLNTGIDAVGFDMHPAYNISSLAGSIPADRYYGIYHHHAHFASCLAENGFENKAIGVILDGTGYGEDGKIWGFEIVSGDYLSYKREYHQSYIPLPGGELAAGSPWRTAVSFLIKAMGAEGLVAADQLFGNLFEEDLKIVAGQLEKNINTILSSSCGRLFDAVAAMLGLCMVNTYDGQAAIQLSELLASQIPTAGGDHYPFEVTEDEISFLQMFPALLHDLKNGKGREHIARCFHDTLALAIKEAVLKTANRTGLDFVALSGGSWLNPYLLQKTVQLLNDEKLTMLLHKDIPPNDGGLSLGQAAIALWRLKRDVPGSANAFIGVRKKPNGSG